MDNTHPDRSNSTPVVALTGVSRRYGKLVALDNLDLTVQRGEILALLGPNGAGKTTTASLVLGLSRPDAGRVRVLGGVPGDLAVRQRIGAMLQTGAVPQTLTVAEHLELAGAWYGDPLPLAEVIALAGLEGLERRLYGRLSGGQQRRVLFAMAICGQPDLLVLDEPTVALDVEARRALWARLRTLAAAGVAILLTTHDLAEAADLASRVVMIHRGRVVADGAPATVAALVGQRRLSCRSRLAPAVVAGWPEVVQATAGDRGRLVITSTDPDAVVRRLLDADPQVAELEIAGASLEEALLSLTLDDRNQGVAA